MAFYTEEELKEIGFKSLGKNVLISDKVSIYFPEKIVIGNNVRIDDFCFLSGEITLGNYIHIGPYTALFGKDGIEMEDFTGLSTRCILFTTSDDYSGETMTNPMIPSEYKKIDFGKIVIKKHSIIGAGSIILPNVIINEGTAVGINSFIKKDTEKWSIYAGNPAKKIKERKQDLLELEKTFLERVEINGI